tara:strand:+ start:216 stop:1130 length:915 start_codon:yes stop_codon:yes gene_type:complete
MKEVIVRLGNGLGNQLFTYAAAYSFSKKRNAKLYIDDESGFYFRHNCELHNFNITAPIVERKYKFLGIHGRFKRRFLQKTSLLKNKKLFLVEQTDSNKLTYFNQEQFNKEFEDRVYFEGYFQSEKYFSDDKKDILKEFSFKEKIINQKNPYIDKIKNTNSVSLHLRREKFLNSEGHKDTTKMNMEHLKKSVDIIKRGISFFDKNVENPVYYLWSNNFHGLDEFFKRKNIIFVDTNNRKDPAYDLYTMSLCKHFILSPSTLHYWASYLCNNSNKISLAPPNIKDRSGYYGFSNNKDIKSSQWTII